MKVYHMKQGSPEWFQIRRGRPTASEFKRIITAVKGDKSKSSLGYARALVGELQSVLYPKNCEWYTSRPMQFGVDCEAEARNWYRLHLANEHPEVEVEEVGFCMSDDGRMGFSPDGIMPSIFRGLEVKCVYVPEIQLERIEKNELWPEVKAQVHGALAISGFFQWDCLSYSPGLAPLVIQVKPDEYTAKVKAALEEFWLEYLEMMKRHGIEV